MGCFYADECNIWNDIAPYDAVLIVERSISVALCESRHEIPQAVNGSVFEETISNPTDFEALRSACEQSLNPAFNAGVRIINLYTTGLSTALLTVVNYCRECGIKLITWHFDRVTGEYVPLSMVE